MTKPKLTAQQARIKALREQDYTTAEIAAKLLIDPASVRSMERYKRKSGKAGRPARVTT